MHGVCTYPQLSLLSCCGFVCPPAESGYSHHSGKSFIIVKEKEEECDCDKYKKKCDDDWFSWGEEDMCKKCDDKCKEKKKVGVQSSLITRSVPPHSQLRAALVPALTNG